MPSAAAQSPRTTAPIPYPASLYAPAAGLLTLELLPLGILLWAITTGGGGFVASTHWVNISLVIAALSAIAAVVIGTFAADVPARRGFWPALVILLLIPPVIGAVILLTSGQTHVRLWLLALLGIMNGQMAAAACLRQAAASIPASRFRAAALDCIRPGQRLRHLILPACAPTLTFLAVLTFLGTWSIFLLAFSLHRNPNQFALGAGATPGNYVTAVYLFASVPMIFLGLWTLRSCLLAPAAPRPFARA